MTQSTPILDLPMTDGAAMDEAEIARVLEEASQIVEGFTDQTAGHALDRLLALGGAESLADKTEAARALAGEMATKTTVLEQEVARFLSLREQL